MKNKRLIIGLSVVLVLIIAVFAVLVIKNKPETNSKEKEIVVTVVYEDKSEKEIKITTEAEFLGKALFEKELISEEDYNAGYITVFEGIRADYQKDNAWWQITKGGQMTDKGMNELPIADGESFEIVHTPS